MSYSGPGGKKNKGKGKAPASASTTGGAAKGQTKSPKAPSMIVKWAPAKTSQPTITPGKGSKGSGSAVGGRGRSSSVVDNTNEDKPTVERKFRQLARMMMNSTPFSLQQAEEFLALGNQVLDSEFLEFRQRFIQDLANESGLRRVVEIVEANYQSDDVNTMNFWVHCVPFLRIISHEKVRSSLVLENAIGTIYNIIYGQSSSRAVPFFQMIVQHLTSTPTNAKTLQSPEFADALYATARALWMTMTFNQSASVQTEFVDITKSIRGCLERGNGGYSIRAADMELRKVEQKLNIAEAIPLASTHLPPPPKQQTSLPSRIIDFDFPGNRSERGPRHDNDSESIVDIKILPTRSEIMNLDRTEYLPIRDYSPTAHHLPPGMRRVLDTQFRLLREDTAGQVREALQYLGDALTKKPTKGAGGANKNLEMMRDIGAQILVHRNILFEAFKIDDREGLQLNVSFDQPPRLTAENMDAAERKRWWTNSRSMQTGNLVCLVDQQNVFTFFIISERLVTAEGNQQGRTNVQDLSSHPTRALVTLKLIDIKNDLDKIIEEYHQHSRYYDDYPVLSMLEFPGMLFASFGPILEYLRNIVAVGGEEAVPFHRLIAPEGNKQTGHPAEDPEKKGFIKIAPPGYLRRGFTLDLSVLKDQGASGSLTHSVNQPCSIPALQAATTLDRGQCEALLGALTRELALIQGPPGTGKSYVGVQLVRVLLHNNSTKLNLGPIVCVCYTNHALDQFLVDLLQHGVSRLVRIGARSQKTEIEPFTLRNVAQRVRTSYPEREAIRTMKGMVDAAQNEIRHLCSRLGRAHYWTTLKTHLEARHPKIHEQLFAVLEGKPDKEGYILKTYHKPENVIDDWINMRYLPQIPSLDRYTNASQLSSMTLEQLMNSDLSILSRPQRMQMKEYWEDEIKNAIHTELKRAIAKFHETKQALETSYQDRARNCLQEAEVVGVTTTGLAGHADLLRGIQAKVLICEEAGEVLEAHTLTALLPSVQHAILIGDHQQLRPHISNYSLSMESKQGVYYSLDESLFERLIRQRYGADNSLRFPFATLDTQRRMYPSISNLVRQTLYPHLKDHPTVHKHPEVEGMARRLFWFDHTQLENNADNKDPTVTSKTNEFEVSMVTALVTHLVKQGCYEEGEIAVITPYLGQLMRLRRQLDNIYQIVLGDKDQEEVELAGLVGDLRAGATAPGAATVNTIHPEVPKEKPKKKLRLSTVDNFQGEEAKVIVVSLVRCNPARRCGFLKTSNRINVLLSRARHGMYIVGNSDTARPVQMWSEVLTLFARDGNIGETMQLRCPRHPQKQIVIRKPEDFLLHAPDGGCEVPCGKKLDDCQHLCPDFCHSEALHKAVICPQKCQRKLPGCNHRCRATCGERCPECIVNIPQVLLPCEHLCYNIPCHQAQVPEDIMCMTPIVQRVPRCGHEHIEPCSVDITDEDYQCVTPCDLPLSCGHIASNIPCYQTRMPEEVICRRSVMKTVPRCGHEKSVACHFDITNPEYKCDTICGEELECGHACQGRCWECNQGKLHILADEDDHVPCRTPCGRLHESCGHACRKPCHVDLECGTCDRPCDFGCSHSRCPKGCGETCVPCVLPCKSSCNHRGKCKMPCAHPCNVLPCDKRCLRRLRCGHQCPSLCGEACPEPEFCQQCATPDVRSRIVDMHRQTKYEKADLNSNPVIIPPCGHLLTVKEMDKLMRMEEVYEYQGGNIVRQRPLPEWINNHLERTQIQCPECTFPFDASSNRYNRISKCATMVGLTNRLVSDASKQFLSLEQQIEQFERQSKNSRIEFAHSFIATSTENTEFGIGGVSINHMPIMIAERHKDIVQLTKNIQEFIASISENEQPFLTLYAQVSTGSRPRNPRSPSTSTLDDLSVNPRYRLLAQVLYLRLEWARIMDIFEIARLGELQGYQTDIRRTVQAIPLLLPSLQSTCKRLESEASAALQYAHCIEAKLFHARFTALELALPPRSYRFIPPPQNVTFYPRQEDENRAYVTMKRNREIANLTEALTTCINHPIATRSLRPVVEQGLQILPGESVFRDLAVTKEQQMLYAAMRGREWAETKEWIFCVNRHPLAMVEIGTPLSTAKCPQCEEPLAGQGQANVGRGPRRTSDLDLQFGRMRI